MPEFNEHQKKAIADAVRAEVFAVNQKILERLEAISLRLEQGDGRMEALAVGIEQNNASTADMREAFDIAKRGLQMFGAIGAGISWLVRKGWPLWGPIAAAIAWWKGAPPPDHHH